MANYCTADDVYLVHGATNIFQWADLDNRKVESTILDRVNWAIELSTEYINGRLYRGRYNVPFVTASVPIMIKHITALFAGVLLYDGRRVATDVRDMILPKRKHFKQLLREILTGQLRLVDKFTGEVIESDCEIAPQIGSGVDRVVVVNQFWTTRMPGSGLCSAWCNTCCCHSCVCRSLMLSARDC